MWDIGNLAFSLYPHTDVSEVITTLTTDKLLRNS